MRVKLQSGTSEGAVMFKREARWLMIVVVAGPAIGFLVAILIPALMRWLAAGH